MKIVLKKATIKDIPELVAVEKKLTGLKTFSAMATEKEWQDEFKKDNFTIYLIMNDGKVVGNVSYEKNPDGSVYLSGFAIDPEFQGKGIGRQVMNQIMEELASAKKITLMTHPENTAAVKLYSSFGFVVRSRKENYFGDGEPRIEMVLAKKLKNNILTYVKMQDSERARLSRDNQRKVRKYKVGF